MWWGILAKLAYIALEAWLGKTNKTDAGSVLGASWNLLRLKKP